MCPVRTTAPDYPSDVEAALREFISAFNALDFERFANCLAADVSLFAPDPLHPTRIDGAASVASHFRRVFEAAAPEGPNIRPVEISVTSLSRDAALVTFNFHRHDGSSGRRTIVFRREGSDLRVLHIHASNVASLQRDA